MFSGRCQGKAAGGCCCGCSQRQKMHVMQGTFGGSVLAPGGGPLMKRRRSLLYPAIAGVGMPCRPSRRAASQHCPLCAAPPLRGSPRRLRRDRRLRDHGAERKGRARRKEPNTKDRPSRSHRGVGVVWLVIYRVSGCDRGEPDLHGSHPCVTG